MSVKTPVLVFCRIKPYTSDSNMEIQEYSINGDSGKDTLIISYKQTNHFVNNKPECHNFQFVKVFDQGSSQELIYETVAKPVVQSVLNGFNGTVFAYGQTGSGKTYTISGDRDSPGIVHRALYDLFTATRSMKGETFDIQMSYLEIYNEQSNDLLIPVTEEKKKILLRERPDKAMEWHNLSLRSVETFSEAKNLLLVGDSNRIVCDTPMNIFSSRSHTVLTIHLTAHIEHSLQIRRAKLNLVDLAGSERVHKTGEEGIVLEEARHINLSLHYLEQVIVALSDNSRTHVPYRNCTLTSALRDSLGGNCMTVMMANIAVDKNNMEETVSTCRFAQRVALVRNELSVNTERDVTVENERLRAEIQQLRHECTSLQAKVRDLQQMKNTEEWMKTLEPDNDEGKLSKITRPSTEQTESLTIQQLQSDIIYLIWWLQEEINPKLKDTKVPVNSSNCCELSTDDLGFESFIATVKKEEDWFKAKAVEQRTEEEMTLKLDTINSVHQDILNWWRYHEKSLVSEILSNHSLSIPGSVSETELVPTGSATVDMLLNTHSDLLKDFQLLKSRLQSSKRNLQRIKRKYSLEYNNWKKSDRSSSESIFNGMNNQGSSHSSGPSEVLDVLKIYGINDVTDEIIVENNTVKKHFKPNSSENIETYMTNSKYIDSDEENENVFSLDILTVDTCDDFSDRICSTSPLLSENRKPVDCEPRRYHLYSTSGEVLDLNSHPTILQLTGEQDIDDEIIAFYQSKCLNQSLK